MQSKHGISIDVLNANTPGRIPLSVLLEGGITLVRVPHGPFKVRVITPHPTDVGVTLDDKALVSVKIPAGMTELGVGQDGRPFTFSPARSGEDTPVANVLEEPVATEGFDESVAPEILADAVLDGMVNKEALSELAPTQPSHISGFLVVSVKFSEQPPTPGILPPPYDEDAVAFQMNPPAEHARAVAANFNRMVPPEKIEKRWCSCCRRFDER